MATIVVAFDDEPASRAAIRFAADEALRRHGSLTVVHALTGYEKPVRTDGRAASFADHELARLRLREDIQRAADIAVDLALVVTGLPITEEMQRQSAPADLLVYGVHHRLALLNRLIELPPAAAAGRAGAPVILVPAATLSIAHIVIGYDGSGAAVAAARWAAAEAALRSLRIRAVRAESRHDPGTVDWSALDGIVAPDDRVTAYGEPAGVLERTADGDGLIVVGRHAQGLPARHSVIRALTAGAAAPVVVVPELVSLVSAEGVAAPG